MCDFLTNTNCIIIERPLTSVLCSLFVAGGIFQSLPFPFFPLPIFFPLFTLISLPLFTPFLSFLSCLYMAVRCRAPNWLKPQLKESGSVTPENFLKVPMRIVSLSWRHCCWRHPPSFPFPFSFSYPFSSLLFPFFSLSSPLSFFPFLAPTWRSGVESPVG